MRCLEAALVMAIALGGSAFAAQGKDGAKMRFKEMDKNGDGRIVRAEWRGSTRSFEVHDWNGDGVLSGDEVRPGAKRQARGLDQEDLDSPHRESPFDDWTVRGFESLDHDGDRRITANEWHFEREGFRRADHDRDGVISRAEFLNENAIDDDRDDRFRNLDDNNDGRISRAEWHGTADLFAALDDDRSGFLTPNEMYGDEPPPDLFSKRGRQPRRVDHRAGMALVTAELRPARREPRWAPVARRVLRRRCARVARPGVPNGPCTRAHRRTAGGH